MLHHGECLDNLHPPGKLVDSEWLHGLTPFDDVLRDTEVVVHLYSTGLRTSTTLSLVELAVLLDDTNGNTILRESQSKHKTAGTCAGLRAK